VPLITHDPASVNDLMLVEIIDTLKPDYAQLAFGTLYPGYVDPDTGSTLYADFAHIDTQAIDGRFSKRIYQKMPGSWVVVDKPDPDSGDVTTVSRRKNLVSAVTPIAVTIPTIDPGPWEPADLMSIGDARRPVSGNLSVQFVITAISGTTSTGLTEPEWNYGLGNTTIESDLTWTTFPQTVALAVTEREGINAYLCNEVVTNFPNP
jgi:hypothetical protein